MAERDETEAAAPEKGERIAKTLARAGMCSRREAERWIADRRVAVNGTILETPAFVVKPDDIVAVDGVPLQEKEKTRLWRYHKPAGLVTTHSDPQGRPTVFQALPDTLPRVISIGRLDLNSEGLLLLTNDGALARKLELPATGWIRRYRVRVHGEVDPARLVALEKGVTVDGVRYGPINAVLDRVQKSNAWLTVALHEGKNREIRNVMDHLGLSVTRLIRTAYGPFQLGNLEAGQTDEVAGRVLRDQLGLERKESTGNAVRKDAPNAAPHVIKNGTKPAPKHGARPAHGPKPAEGKPASRKTGRPPSRESGKPGPKNADRRRKV
jgi:23S rRNA pseudouridine2605 synthase